MTEAFRLWRCPTTASSSLTSGAKKPKPSSSSGKPPLPTLRRGLTDENLCLARFRFNQRFQLASADAFLRDLFRDPAVLSGFAPVSGTVACSGVKHRQLNTEVVSMSFFDFLHEKDITTQDGYIRKEMEELCEGISLGDRLRKALLWEESEHFCALQTDTIQNEFLFKLFQLVAIGGAVCQYEENAHEYLDVVKGLYKDLVSVVRDSASGAIKVASHAFLVEAVEGLETLFPTPGHPQNWFFVVVDPVNWHVTLLYHKWTAFW